MIAIVLWTIIGCLFFLFLVCSDFYINKKNAVRAGFEPARGGCKNSRTPHPRDKRACLPISSPHNKYLYWFLAVYQKLFSDRKNAVRAGFEPARGG